MRFSLLAFLTAPLLALALPNPFKIPQGGLSATGGKPLTLEWTPTTSGTITLVLRSGSANDLSEGTIIASSIANSGSYTWTPSNSITSGTDYAIEIVDDSDLSQVNYTPPFKLDTTTTEAKSTNIVTLGAPKSSIISHAPTGSQTGPIPTPSSSYSIPLHNTFTHLTTLNSSTSATGLTTLSHSPSSSANYTMPGSTSTMSTGGAARATAMAVGMVGVALGALAL